MKNFIQNKLNDSLINEVSYLDKNNKGVDKIRVYHGITSNSMLNNLLKRGLSGSEIIKRVNSNETANDNGLFVTTDFDFAKSYAKSGRIIEFTVKNSDLISVTDGVSKSFNWDTPQDNLLSDKPEALFIGDLNPNMINSVWVLENNKWVKLSRKEYIRKYNPNVKKGKLDIFLPTDDLDFGYLINTLFNGKYNTTSFDNFIKKISIGDFKSLKRILFPKQLEQLDNLVKTGELEKYKQTQQTESKILIKNLLREGLNESELLHKPKTKGENKYLNEAVDQFNYDSDKPSPTVSWDVVQDNIDKSVQNINNEDDVEDYLKSLTNKIKGLSPKIKKRFKKYAITALIGVVGISTVNNVVGDMDSGATPNKIDLVNNPKKVDHTTNNPKIGDRRLNQSIPNKVSNNLIKSLKHDEGSIKHKGEPVLKAYDLGDDKITIGWGHAEDKDDSKYKIGQKISKQEAESLFKKDLLLAKDGVDDIFNSWKDKGIEFNITQGMYDAMISMAFNMGRQGFRNTEFIQLVKQGKYKEAKEKILSTNVTYAGHVPRREKESNMFKLK